jgi:hypothetical protein
MPKLQKKHSALKREHPALQKMKILSFFLFLGSFLPSWIRIQQLKLIRIQIRIRNPDLSITNNEKVQISKSKPKKISILCTFKGFTEKSKYLNNTLEGPEGGGGARVGGTVITNHFPQI